METTVTVDAADRTLSREIAEARDALLALVEQQPEQWWTARDLKVRTRNGWSSGVMGLALQELLEEGILERRATDLRIRRAK
jgi:RNA:NAD 2'-phosphotransferase (TPT1/KptA family)